MTRTIHHATREVPAGRVRKILDNEGLSFLVVVDGDRAFDARLYPFPELCGVGIPASELRAAE